MPIDLALLATTVVGSFLVPYVKLGAEKIAEGLTGKLSEAATDEVSGLTKKIWNRVKTAFSSEGEQFTLSQLNENPDAAKPLVETILKKKLEQDPKLAEELEQLVNAPVAGGSSTGAQIMNAYIASIIDLSNANFSGSHGVEITGVKVGELPDPASPQRPDSSRKRGTEEDHK
ncbi:MAG TPA: hypothetical protein VKA70_17795 [Blastocatellia bacterium]|nr:hypothetical protein [Blastocatellia bacterium]